MWYTLWSSKVAHHPTYDDSLTFTEVDNVKMKRAFTIWKMLWTTEEIVMYG